MPLIQATHSVGIMKNWIVKCPSLSLPTHFLKVMVDQDEDQSVELGFCRHSYHNPLSLLVRSSDLQSIASIWSLYNTISRCFGTGFLKFNWRINNSQLHWRSSPFCTLSSKGLCVLPSALFCHHGTIQLGNTAYWFQWQLLVLLVSNGPVLIIGSIRTMWSCDNAEVHTAFSRLQKVGW